MKPIDRLPLAFPILIALVGCRASPFSNRDFASEHDPFMQTGQTANNAPPGYASVNLVPTNTLLPARGQAVPAVLPHTLTEQQAAATHQYHLTEQQAAIGNRASTEFTVRRKSETAEPRSPR